MLDNSLPLKNTKRNVDILQEIRAMRTLDIKFWDWTNNFDLDDKAAPCDEGREIFEYILENEIEDVKLLESIDDE
jgi:hypothetical protein